MTSKSQNVSIKNNIKISLNTPLFNIKVKNNTKAAKILKNKGNKWFLNNKDIKTILFSLITNEHK